MIYLFTRVLVARKRFSPQRLCGKYLFFHSGQTMPSNGSRSSPVSTKSNRASPQGFAGSKCFEPPTPNSLPKPPSNWTPFQFPSKQNLFGNLDILTFGEMTGSNNHAEMHLDNHSTARDVSQELQLILKANA